MKCLLIFSLALCCTPAFTKTSDSHPLTEADLAFEKFVETYSKKYENSIEEKYRKKIFADNLIEIHKHNELYYSRKSSFIMGVNQYSDLLNSEFVKLKTGLVGKPNPADEIKSSSDTSKAPESLDWREKGAVTQVKNQGNCGSCWSFSATGAIEAQHFLNTSQLIEMSEQNLIDCSYGKKYNNYGCRGGLMTGAFDYVIDNKGISKAEKYPYEAVKGDCRYSPDKVGATIAGYKNLSFGDENALKLAVAEIGPVSVGIDASGIQMQHYKNGIFYQKDCNPINLNHGVLVVGYGKTGSNDEYWLVKNSWGVDWGNKGYVKMPRNRNNHCGIASMASVPYNT